jgi:hypothetical protein
VQRLIKGLLILSLFLPVFGPRSAQAQSAVDPCALALAPEDLPGELQPQSGGAPSLNISDDPNICERLFQAQGRAPGGLTTVRSIVLVTPSSRRAISDYQDYRGMLLKNGWQEVEPQPIGDTATVFVGSDERAGIYSVQQLFRRGYVLGMIEATGPILRTQPELILDYAALVDRRVLSELTTSFGNPLRSASIWPLVSNPTLVAEGKAGGGPLVGQNIRLGGFSGLAALDGEGVNFVAVTDRGPNFDLRTSAGKQLIMPLPAYAPSIVKLERKDGELQVVDRIGLRLQAGYTNPRTGTPFVTGLPNDEQSAAAFDVNAKQRWGTDPTGVDPEGITIDPRDGSYWICEEYGPSILHVDRDGVIQARYMPVGARLDAPGQNIQEVLPSELLKRKENRGFEGIAISPTGDHLFAIMQSPLSNPNEKAGEASRTVRIISLDITGSEPAVDGMYVYLTEPYDTVGVFSQDDVKIGDLSAISGSRLLVAEHDSLPGGGYKMVYLVDLKNATNILGRDDFGGRRLEQNDAGELGSLGVQVVQKTGVVNLANVGWRSKCFEGLTLVDESTIAVIDDNNFGVGGLDQAGRLASNYQSTRLGIVHLPSPLTQ